MAISKGAINVRNISIGGEEPCICAPVVGVDAEQVLAETRQISAKKPHLIEWRADFFNGIHDDRQVVATAKQMRTIAGEIPILFTVRSEREGGRPIPLTEEEKIRLFETVCQSGAIDLLDYELVHEPYVATVRQLSRQYGVRLILSYHNFDFTPAKEELVAKMRQAGKYGADIAKVAVMPKSLQDVLVLLQATEEARQELPIPLITMSMGGLGAITRLAGGLFGSAVTFAVGQQSSAPGQIPIEEVKDVLSVIMKYSQ
ncbi:type I 3-dehydroquinate dehydratase [Geobacillus sp. BMUD]|uniref:type I 3-dehydroquinate dehydratase n=1 Tax=Geobacillus TaxID=129337 RepID=UPI0004DF6A65|nr:MULTISPECIES: type I 3-dehydroquinate dehydratase [Geobacillus]NNU83445.1 type I 3-dehydroquinate dehydratase [Geobacillus sp. BMUD]